MHTVLLAAVHFVSTCLTRNYLSRSSKVNLSLTRLITIPACDRRTDGRKCYGYRELQSPALSCSPKKTILDWVASSDQRISIV